MGAEGPTQSKTFIPIEELKPGTLVCDAFGSFTQVQSIVRCEVRECEVVQLTAHGIPSLTVTAAHRVVKEKCRRSCETVPAEQLKVGDTILCSGGQQVLEGVLKGAHRNIVVHEVTFRPDVPVLAFDTAGLEMILTKGMKKTRRGGRSGQSMQKEISSIPDTEYSWPA